VQIPRSCQCLLMSATSSAEVERLQKLVLHNPTTLNLLGNDADASGAAGPGPGSAAEIEHFHIACDRCGSQPSFSFLCTFFVATCFLCASWSRHQSSPNSILLPESHRRGTRIV
jgi:hypothetical protein